MKGFGILIVSLVFALFVSGCATNYADKSQDEVAKGITVKNSEFDSSISYIGPQAMSETRRGLSVDNETVQLLAIQNKKTKATKYIVYARILYSFDWRFYNSVSFSDGNTVPVKQLSQVVDSCTGAGCIHTEEISFPIGLEKLKEKGGFRFRLNSKSDVENIIALPKNYIEGFVGSVQQHEKSA